MKLYRFSLIKTQEELFEAIKHTHFMCFELCHKAFGQYLPVAGNIGIFCHYPEEYEYLTKVRKELTTSENWNQKYYKLLNPIVIEAQGDIPKTVYTHLYIRLPDQYRAQVGDVDFVMNQTDYTKFQELSKTNAQLNGVKLADKPHLEMFELSHPDVDALAYIGTTYMSEKSNIIL